MGRKNKIEIKYNFYHVHLARQRGTRGRKLSRVSMFEDLKAIGKVLHVPVYGK